ncbi:Regulatory sensor-transducer, BlaR1/MecR1 family / TonB-dependent receptor, partial [hydrothermal vent metagenome]
MIIYILKFSACLALFLVFYKLVLEKENMHVFKRFYLLGTLLLSIAIPLITFTYYVEPSVEIIPQITQNIPLQNSVILLEPQIDYLPIILWSIYGLGVFLFGVNFLRNLYQLNYKIKHNPKQKNNRITNVLLKDLVIPHTFFNYIFLNKQKFETHQIPKEVFWHEETHAIQKHSIDVLFIEILQIVFWFNPLIYFIKHAVKLNHEFLADQAVIKKGVETATYQETLLAFSSNAM